jgi:hypothetical protein
MHTINLGLSNSGLILQSLILFLFYNHQQTVKLNTKHTPFTKEIPLPSWQSQKKYYDNL